MSGSWGRRKTRLDSLLSEDGDEDALKNWRVWRELSVRKYAEEYDCLNIHFDEYTGESQVTQEDMRKAIDQHDVAGLVEESQGARIIDLEKYKPGKAIVRKKGMFGTAAIQLAPAS